MIYKSEIKFFIILEIKKLEELSKNTYVEIIQKPNHISILIKSRISNSQKVNNFLKVLFIQVKGKVILILDKKIRNIIKLLMILGK